MPTEDQAFDRWYTFEKPGGRRRELPQRDFDTNYVKRQVVKAAVAEVAKAVGGNGAGPVMPGAQFQGGWNNLGNASMAMVQRVTANMAQQFDIPVAEIEQELVEQGLTWGPPFPPGRPLDPFFGYRRPPRTRDFQVGENVQITPRWNRVSFKTIKAIYDAYDVAQICVRHLINDVRSLEFSWEPMPGMRDDISEDLVKARQFFDSPDRRQPFRAWLSEYLQDVLRYDAGCLYVRRSEDGTPIALEVVDGTTMIPLVDYYGRPARDEDDDNPPADGEMWDGGNTPGFLQIIQGMPWDWLTADDIIYQPWNPLPDSQYGLAPLEAVLLTANTDLRFQWHFLQFFTEGTMPAGFMEAPPDMSDPTQIAEWQETWDAIMVGDQAKLRQIRWVPAGAQFHPAKPESTKFDAMFPLYLLRRVAASFGVTPNDLGFTEDVNRATGDTQIDVQFRVGTLPLVRHVEDVINLFIARELKLRVRLAFDAGRETEDRVATAQAEKIYIESGVLSPDEPRKRLGYEIDKERPVARFINNTRTGPIPLIALESMAGKVDPDTYAPDKSQPLVPNPYMMVPGTLPPEVSPEGKAGLQASAQAGRDMLAQSTGQQPSPAVQALIAQNSPAPPGQNPATTAQPNQTPPAQGKGATPEPAQAQSTKSAWEKINDLLDELGVEKMETAGLTAATGVQGSGLIRGDDDEDDEDEAVKELELALTLRRWRENSRNRLRKGLKPRRFNDPDAPQELLDAVWTKLQAAGTRQEVDAVFADAVPLARKGKEPIDGVIAGGLIIQALDSGRVLLIQRTPDKHDDDATFARWEFPGGCLDEDDAGIWDGALREWSEETGASLPESAVPQGAFMSPDGKYQGYVFCIASESDLSLDPQPDEVADIGWWDPADLDDGRVRDKVKECIPSLQQFLAPGVAKAGAPPTGFHRHTDRIVQHYAPLIAKALEETLPQATIAQAIAAGRQAQADTILKDASEPPPNLRQATDLAESCQTCKMFSRDGADGTDGVCWGFGNYGVDEDQTCDRWYPSERAEKRAPLLGVAAVIQALTNGSRPPKTLETTLTALYGDAALQAAHEAAHASGGTIVASLQGVTDQLPADYWDQWQPGWGEAAAKAADGGLADLLDQADVTIKGIQGTTLDRLGNVIADSIGRGDSLGTTTQAVQDFVSDPNRAYLIADTETARAMTATSLDTYTANGVEKVEWLLEGDACELCQENADESPQPLGASWPNGAPPAHPRCRCALSPVIDLSGETE